LLAPGGEIVIPPKVGRVDHEVEIAVIIGKSGRYIAERKALEYVAGYTIVNDITARELQKKDVAKGKPWLRSKSYDTFCPMGPYLIPKDEIGDLSSLSMELRVNDEVRQKTTLDQMIFNIPQIISYLSQYMTLVIGDIICTGTPEGVSQIKPGDQLEAEIENIGILRNTVIEG
jgi:2-keto-4-pentenoate hydratase/2-oxohepta-3-ene-1,7-dioic acid hydratase in catechol pathway